MTPNQYDAIAVLGRSLNPDSSLAENDKVRLDAVANLYRNRKIRAIIVCGSHGYKGLEKPTLSQAQAYAIYLQSLNIPIDDIHLEARSQETLGNILFTKLEILQQHNWHRILVIPTYNHSTERITYLLSKVLGEGYSWDILRIGENKDQVNTERETKSFNLTKEINDRFVDGDHASIYEELMNTHPAYGGSKWTIDELRQEMKH